MEHYTALIITILHSPHRAPPPLTASYTTVSPTLTMAFLAMLARMYYTVLNCTILYCTVLYCTDLAMLAAVPRYSPATRPSPRQMLM